MRLLGAKPVTVLQQARGAMLGACALLPWLLLEHESCSGKGRAIT